MRECPSLFDQDKEFRRAKGKGKEHLHLNEGNCGESCPSKGLKEEYRYPSPLSYNTVK